MKKESTRDKILKAALSLLENSGVKGLTQPAVAKLVGIPQGQLTYHFKHRADLILAVTDSAMDGIAEYLWTHHPELASRSFSKMISLVMELMQSKTRIRALLGLIVEADESDEVLSKLKRQGDKVRSLIAAAFQLDDLAPEITISHSIMIGFAIMFFLEANKEKRKTLESHFQKAVEVLQRHIQENSKKKKGKGKK